MKKSELKALIKEVIQEMPRPKKHPMHLQKVSGRNEEYSVAVDSNKEDLVRKIFLKLKSMKKIAYFGIQSHSDRVPDSDMIDVIFGSDPMAFGPDQVTNILSDNGIEYK